MAVYKDKERGTWYFRTRVKDHNGDTKEKTKRGFKTKAEAKLQEQLLKVGKVETKEFYGFSEMCDLFLQDSITRVKESTSIGRETDIRLHFKPFFKNKLMNLITAKDIRDWQNWQIETLNPTEQTLKQRQKKLSNIFNFCIAYYDLPKNPTHLSSAKQFNRNLMKKGREMTIYDVNEWKLFISHAISLKAKVMLSLLFYCGMRKGEACALAWTDIDLVKKEISITETLTKSKNNPTKIGTTKTVGSERKTAIPNVLNDLLIEYKEYHKKSVPGWKESFYIGKDVKPLNASALNWMVIETLKKSNTRKIVPHDLRHTHVSLLIQSGANILAISKRIGHTDISTTLNVYGHLFPNDDHKIAEKIDELVK